MTTHSLKVGKIIEDRYELLEQLGAGGFGVVFGARQLSTGQRVAIKFLLDKERDYDAVGEERFRREMALIAQLKHPNIVRLIDSGTTQEGTHFTVLEFVDGEELAELIQAQGKLNVDDSLRLMSQVLEALATAHGAGVVHRDLKPQNIMVTGTGRLRNAMVLDFGISTLIEEAQGEEFVRLTQTGQIHGTPAYMAPEQLRGEVSVQSDLYAWGLCLLECLTGRPAIEADSVATAIYMQLSPDPIPLPEALPRDLRALLAKATAKDPQNRSADALDLLQGLEDLRRGNTGELSFQLPESPKRDFPMRETVDESLDIDLEVSDTLQARLPNEAAQATQVSPKAASSSKPWLVVGLVVVLGLLGAGLWFFTKNESSLTEESCEAGQVQNPDTQGHCCWPGQAWNGERCVGTPTECPADRVVNPAKQSCVLPPCRSGRVRVDESHCCWPEQAWSSSQNQCVGAPKCPDKTMATTDRCLELSNEAWLNYTACEAGNMNPCIMLALQLQTGVDAEHAPAEALAYLERACAAANPTGCFNLAVALQIGEGTEPDPERAKELYSKACANGQKESCFELAAIIQQASADDYQVIRYLERACGLGHTMACDQLGLRYRYGFGVQVDPEQALVLLRRSCKGGFMYGCTHLAGFLEERCGGDLSKPECGEVIGLLERGCEAGETFACVHLAEHLEQGRGIAKDLERAKQIRAQACADGWYESCESAEEPKAEEGSEEEAQAPKADGSDEAPDTPEEPQESP